MSSEETSPPEKTSAAIGQAVSPARRRRLQQCFEHGRANVAKGNHDYAIQMFTQCVVGDPGNLIYAQSFLATLHKKYNNNKKGGTLASIKGTGSRATLKKATGKKDWDSAAKAAVELLKLNPWDASALLAMANICEQLQADEGQLFFLKMALNTNPKDAEINRLAGLALARVGQFDQAIACWHRVEQAKPQDEESRRMISQLTVDKTIKVGGYGDANREGKLTMREDASPSASGERAKTSAETSQTPEQKLLAAIAESPDDTTLYLDLVDLYTREDKFAEAEGMLSKAIATSGGDMKLRERLEDLQIRRHKQQLDIALQRAAEEQTPAAHELAKRMKAEVNQIELEVFAARSDRNPGNELLKYELGIRLKRAGKFNDAIQALQQARGEGKRKASVFLELGECFQYIKQYRLAMNNYDEAIAACSDRDTETRKLALYRAGVLAMGLKEWEAAEKHLSTLAGIDFGYKDVADRLDKLAQMRNKE